MIRKGKLENGFEFEIDDAVLDDMELIDTLAEADGGDALAASRAFSMVVGKEQKKRLYDYIRNEDGRVPIETAVNALTEMLETLGDDGKNS